MIKNNIKLLFLGTIIGFLNLTHTSATPNQTLTEADHENNINMVVENVAKAMPKESSVDDLIAAAVLLKTDLLFALNTIPQTVRYQNLIKALHNLNIKSIAGQKVSYTNALTFANQIKYFQDMLKNLPAKSRDILVSKIPANFKPFMRI